MWNSILDLRERLFWLAGRIFGLLPRNAVIRIPTGINKGFRWIRGAANAPEWMGIYERSKLKVVRGLVNEGRTIFDIGANAGFYTLAFSRLVGPHGEVVAFEPLGQNCAKIIKHLALNRIENVTLMQCAVSDSTGLTSFHVGINDFVGKISTNGFYIIPTFSLDDFLARRRIADPDLLKIDVEGAEVAVLRGARKMLERSRPIVLLALHGESQCSECFEILRNCQYKVRTLGGDVITEAKAMPLEVIAAVEKESETFVAACKGESVEVSL